MEGGLGDQSCSMAIGATVTCLNPCFNGGGFRSLTYVIGSTKWGKVLILVLMEEGLGVIWFVKLMTIEE